ncbi:flavin-containing monooxygenase [Variovorax sp. ZT4R33]|uniref:flavin-containing monooxygenase n=1 Tax=Variovorax sp. ZT4R33 TaxID=3443743 RepID=UPI003F447620
METNIKRNQRQALSEAPSDEYSPAHGLRAMFDQVSPITASDEEIQNAVAEADLPALMATLAMITGDTSLIAPDLKPSLPPMTTVIAPQGGMDAQAQEKARRLAVTALIRHRDAGSQRGAAPSPALVDECVKFLIRGDIEEFRSLLEHELGIAQDLGAPGWTQPEIAPTTAFRVAVIGAGVSGIASAYRLQQAQMDFTVFEKNDEVGGVWWENRYPGCRLDTPNFAYSLSFAQKPDWPQEFSLQPEIHAYLAQVASTAGMRARIRFGTSVESMRFEESRATWTLEIRQPTGTVVEEEFHAVITAVGILNRPSLPDIPGLESFQGQVVHSAAWPEDLDLKGKRVALVGTGASAFQIGPSIVDTVDELKVFQRNPPWLLPTPIYHSDIKPGMLWLLNHVPYYGRWFRFWQFWIAIEGRLPLTEVEDDWDHPISVGRANEALRQGCLESLARQFVDRPDLLAKMTPNYPPAAKRMLRDNGAWAAMLKNPHVDLNTTSISCISASGIETSDGLLHEVDVIVCATGFKAADFLWPMKITGLDGRDLHEDVWQGDCRAYLGITVPGFPNLFMTGGPNTAVVINGSAIFSSECQVEYSMRAIGHLLRTGHKAMDCKESPFTEYNDWVDQGNLKRAWGAARTSSWYKNSKGRASQTWPFGLLDYWKVTGKFCADDYAFLD